jgi:hypothetical protein
MTTRRLMDHIIGRDSWGAGEATSAQEEEMGWVDERQPDAYVADVHTHFSPSVPT